MLPKICLLYKICTSSFNKKGKEIFINNSSCGGKSPNWNIGSWALFEDMDTSEEE